MLNFDKPSRIFPCILLICNHMIFLVQFGINKHLLIFSKTTNCTRPTGSSLFQIALEIMWLPILTPTFRRCYSPFQAWPINDSPFSGIDHFSRVPTSLGNEILKFPVKKFFCRRSFVSMETSWKIWTQIRKFVTHNPFFETWTLFVGFFPLIFGRQ